MVYVKYILASLPVKEKVELFKRLYEEVAGMGINGDTELAHINKHEGAILKMMGGAGTINEETGLIQYFGGSPPPPPAASSTVTQQATIPDEMKPYITDVMTQAQALNKQRTEEGYVPYQGAQIADFQAEQTQAQQGIAGLVGTGQQYFDKASALTEQAGQAPTAEAMQSYMSPYMQNVVDIQKREALRQGDVAAQGQAARAVQAGAFGGSRDAIIQAENERNQQTLLNDIQAKGQAAAYADAQQQYAAQQRNALAAGAQYGQLGTAVPGQAMKEFGALESVGAAKQQQEQQALNIAKQQFIQEQTFPEANLQQYSSIIRGYNLPPNTYQTAQTTTPAPSYMQQIAGLGMAGAGIAGAFGGFGKKEGGLVGLAKGGKVLRRAEGGGLQAIRLAKGGQTQVEILRNLPSEQLQQMLGNPDFSPTLVKQEIEKRNSSSVKPAKSTLQDALEAKQMQVHGAGKGGLENYNKYQPQSPLVINQDDNVPVFEQMRGMSEDQLFSEEEGSNPLRKVAATAEFGDRLAAKNPELAGLMAVPPSLRGFELLTPEQNAKYGPKSTGAATDEPQILLGTQEKTDQQDVEADGKPTGVPLLKGNKDNEITSGYKPVPIADLKQTLEAKKTAAVEQSPYAESLANDIYSDAISKLQASTEKKKTAMSERAAGLDQAKWLAVADMGFQMMAAPGGATFIQALGGAAGKSGIAGKLASLSDKQKEMAFNLAEMDENQVAKAYSISKDKAASVVENAKLDLMASELEIKMTQTENAAEKAKIQNVLELVKLQQGERRVGAAELTAQAAVTRANKAGEGKTLRAPTKEETAKYSNVFKTALGEYSKKGGQSSKIGTGIWGIGGGGVDPGTKAIFEEIYHDNLVGKKMPEEDARMDAITRALAD